MGDMCIEVQENPVVLHQPFTLMVSGPTSCGKTTFLLKLMKHLNHFCPDKMPKKMMLAYGQYQPLYEEMKNHFPTLVLHEGLPTAEDLEKLADGEAPSLCILDDLMESVVSSFEMSKLFTQTCHHKMINTIYLNQNLFAQGKFSRNINLNVHYMILFRNFRDGHQVLHLSRQLYPGRSKVLTSAYRDATSQPFGYLWINLSPKTQNDSLRLCTNIFPDEDGPVVYVSAD